jgi:RNA polymerase sigma-70 factor (ECF subfamily)
MFCERFTVIYTLVLGFIGHLEPSDADDPYEKEFSRFYQDNWEASVDFCLPYVSGRADAEDVTSSAFLVLLGNRKKIRNTKGMQAHFGIMLRHAVITFRRTRARAGNRFCELEMAHAVICQSVTVDQQLMDRELLDQVEKKISELPAQQRLVVRLAKIEDRKQKEISEQLNIEVSTVANHLGAGLKKLRQGIYRKG